MLISALVFVAGTSVFAAQPAAEATGSTPVAKEASASPTTVASNKAQAKHKRHTAKAQAKK